MAEEKLVLRATMRAHNDWVTAIATATDNSDVIVTSSRDKSLILWMVNKEDKNTWLPLCHLTGHSHYVQDVALSSDGRFALSGGCKGELRLWDLKAGTTVRRLLGRTEDVLSVAFSIDTCKIVSASRDNTIKLWNNLGECEYTFQNQDAHSDRISCVCLVSSPVQPTVVSGSWDQTLKIWDLSNCKIKATLTGHIGYVNTVAVSPDWSLCASGGYDGMILLWDMVTGEKLSSFDANSIIHYLSFCPGKYWLCAATEASIKIWDLEYKVIVVDWRVDLKQESEILDPEEQNTASENKVIRCTCLTWSADSSTLFGGFTDGVIRVWAVEG